MRDFDYGPLRNMETYGTILPPVTDFTLLKENQLPVAMYVAKHDLIVKNKDSQWTRQMLKSSTVDY